MQSRCEIMKQLNEQTFDLVSNQQYAGLSDWGLAVNNWDSRKTAAVTHHSVALMPFVHQDITAAPFCHLYRRSSIPFTVGTGDGHDASRPGLV